MRFIYKASSKAVWKSNTKYTAAINFNLTIPFESPRAKFYVNELYVMLDVRNEVRFGQHTWPWPISCLLKHSLEYNSKLNVHVNAIQVLFNSYSPDFIHMYVEI